MKFREKSNGNGGGGKNFLKLEAGESVKVLFRGDVYEFRQHWSEGRGSLCPGRDRCEICASGVKPSFRFRLNAIVAENGALVAKIFEQGWTVYQLLTELHGDYDLEKNQMKITRNGVGKNTTYTITPVPNGAVTPAQEQNFAAVKLLALGHPKEAEAEEEAEEEMFEGAAV